MISFFTHKWRVARSLAREQEKTTKRSPQWHHVEQEHLKRNPTCAGCGSVIHVQVHHIKPFHLHPELELNPLNLITLCMDVEECHLRIGHGGNWKAYNPSVVSDAKESLMFPPRRPQICRHAKAVRRTT